MKAYYDLVRFDHALMIVIAVLISEFIVLYRIPELDPTFLLSLAVPVLIELAAFSLNDYLDREIDRANKRTDRPLVRGDIDEITVVRVFFFSYVLAVGLSVFLPVVPMLIAVSFAFLSILYDVKLKRYPFIGNLYIGFSMGIPFLFGNYVYSEVLNLVNLVLFALGVFVGTAREIIKSVQDLEGDRRAGAKTLPVVIGEKNSVSLALAMVVLFIPLSVYAVVTLLRPGPLSLGVLALAELLVLATIYTTLRREYGLARKYSLVMMFLGLISILLAVLRL